MIKKDLPDVVIVLLGLPGCGKGTQGLVLAKKLVCKHFSLGNEIRKRSVSLEHDLDFALKSGCLLPDSLVNNIVSDFLYFNGNEKFVILDGYPRNMEQALYLKDIGCDVCVLFFDISIDVVIERLQNRFVCNACGAVYSKSDFSHSVFENKTCRECGLSDIKLREDDNIESVNRRLNDAKKLLPLLVQYYRDQNNLFVVEAGNDRDKVSEEVFLIVKKKLTL